jgi:5-methylcytosine-specific restriction endonuclease McrA
VTKQEYQANYRGAHREKNKAYQKQYRKLNGDALRAYDKARRTPEENRRLVAAWKKANPDKVAIQTRRWKKAHPEKVRLYTNRRRCRQLVAGTLTFTEWEWVKAFYGFICLRCKQHKSLTIDHVVPVSLGGRNDISNIQPLCLSCNASKGAKVKDYRRLPDEGNTANKGLTDGTDSSTNPIPKDLEGSEGIGQNEVRDAVTSSATS